MGVLEKYKSNNENKDNTPNYKNNITYLPRKNIHAKWLK